MSCAECVEKVLISGARAPVALSIARSFAVAGFEVHLVDSVPVQMVRWSAFGGARLHRTTSPRRHFAQFRDDLRQLVRDINPVLIVPTCEEVFYYAKAAELDGFNHRLFAPPLQTLRKLHSKAEFPALAAACGLNTPQTARLISRDELQAFLPRSREHVFKPEFSRFAAEALIRPGADQVDKLRPSAARPWVVQEFVSGDEVSIWSAAIRGELVAAAAYKPKWHLAGAGSYFECVDDPGIEELCRQLARGTNMTGQLSLDIIRTSDGALRPIECNPRAVSGVHFMAGDARLADALTGRRHEVALPTAEALHVGPAFWLAAASSLTRAESRSAFGRDYRRARDVLAPRGERLTLVGALIDSARLAFSAVKSGRTSAQESTADIEWNGEPVG